MHALRRIVPTALASLAVSACSSMPPLEAVERVDLERFMGDWYVIANIPTFLEKGAHNAVESYELDSDGTIATTFTFRDGAFDGPVKTYTPRGFITSESNAVWGMQFIWPIKADYRIVYLDETYSTTVIGRNRRDFVWIMAREPQIPAARYDEIFTMLGDVGYDVSEIQRVPQQW
ncbi:MAG: lipocalin family protein [Gammaproteobacteria bacterium]|nr:lipocalin family protein [Gammaproteobacteria bacterium]MDH3505931.1 lipocalin family protein [Gammaproteobacteria bacterium]